MSAPPARPQAHVRATAVAVGTVAAAQVTAAAVTEEAAAYAAWRWIGWRAAVLRFGANAAGQYVGNYAMTGDSELAFARINWVSPFLSAGGVPLMTTALGSAALKLDMEWGYRSVFNGSISGPDMAKDAALGYGFSQLTRVSGFDNLHRSPAVLDYTGGLRYQISLRLNPRFAMGVSAAVPFALEAGNRTTSGAIRKVGAAKVKKHLPK